MSQTPGQNNAASDKFLKKQAQAQGLGADNALAHKEAHAPGEAPVASDSGLMNVGIESGSTNVAGEKGLKDVPVSGERQNPANVADNPLRSIGYRSAPFGMKLIVTGATGFVATEVIRQGLRMRQVTSIVAVARRPVEFGDGIDTSKLRSVVIKDYCDYPDEVKREFAGADACIWTVAVTPTKSRALDFAEVKKICQESTVAGIKAMHEAGPAKPFRFLYMSGASAEPDQSKKPGFMPQYSLMRGETETQVRTFAAKHGMEACSTRSGLINDGGYMRATMAFLVKTFMSAPNVRLEEIAAAMLQQVADGFEKDILMNEDLVRLGQRASGPGA